MSVDPRLRLAILNVRTAFGQLKPRALGAWEQGIEQAFEKNRRRWTAPEAEEAVRALQGLAGRIARGEIYELEQLPLVDRPQPIIPAQGRGIRPRPLAPLLPPPNAPPPRAPEPVLHLLNASYPLEGTVGGAASALTATHSPHLSHHSSPLATFSPPNDTSYRPLFALLDEISFAFEEYIGVFYPREEHGAQLNEQVGWDTAVRIFVKGRWEQWGSEDAGLARVQAREMLEQTLGHIKNDTLQVLPPLALFAMLPCPGGHFANSASFHPSSRPTSSRSSNHGPNPWTSGEYFSLDGYRQTLVDWLHHSQHPQPHPHPQHSPPFGFGGAGDEHNMRELARRHRRMTDRQASRYGTTVRAFAAGM
ncbi:hypothetical protein JCM6882_006140 [Rhodosporidiobolus microsporus]